MLCGRYEGIDQRAIDLVVDDELSVGDFVLAGGELAALCVIEAVVRARPNSVKGVFVQNCVMSTTMSPAVRLDLREFHAT